MDVSIIIPTYNRLWCLPDAIGSCRHTECKTQIIVIDDGSDDGTWDWLCGQEELHLIRQNHLGKCWAANRGFEVATGKYIRFLDSDDQLAAYAIDEQFALAESSHADLVVSGYQVSDKQGQLIRKQAWVHTDDFIAQQLGACDGSHYSAFLFTKKILLDIPHRPDYAFRDDRMFILEIALKNPKIIIHPGYALIHRIHPHNRLQLTQGMQTTTQNYQHLAIYRYILHCLKEQQALTPKRVSAALNVLWPLAHWIAKDHLKDSLQLMNWIRELDPVFNIPEKGILGFCYKKLGFKKTEQMLRFRRIARQILHI